MIANVQKEPTTIQVESKFLKVDWVFEIGHFKKCLK